MPSQQIERIRREVEDIGALPTLPEIPMQVLQMVSSEDSSMEDISRIVERDPALTANILKVANSAYYGMAQKVASLQLALALLGMNEIINIVMGLSVVRTFSSRGRNNIFDRTQFWRHSFGCASAARMLARDLQFDTDGVDFVAGLLHDIGKLIMDQYLHSKLKDIQKLRQKEDITPLEAEVRVMGVDHAMLGSWLGQRWQLPALLLESIAHHHRPLDVLALATPSRQPALTALVHLADILAHEPDLHFTETSQSSETFSDNTAWKIILAERPDLDKEQLEGFITRYDEYRESVNAIVDAVA